MKCSHCSRDLPVAAFRGKCRSCQSCRHGLARFRRLAASRPQLAALTGSSRDCVLAWETARLAFTRALRPWGIDVTWRGFVPGVVVRAGSRADPVPRSGSAGLESPSGDC